MGGVSRSNKFAERVRLLPVAVHREVDSCESKPNTWMIMTEYLIASLSGDDFLFVFVDEGY